MTEAPRARTVRHRLAATLGPESVAVILIAALVAGGLFANLASSRSDGSADGPGSSTPSGLPGVTATDTPAPRPSAPLSSPSTTAASSPVAWANSARRVLEADVRVLEWREALRQEVDGKPKQADELARLLRTMNAAIGVASGRLADLEALPAPVPVVAELQAVHQTALSSSVGTLARTVQDVAAYRRGASDVVRALDPLERLMGELALAAGVPTPVEAPSPSPSSSSAVSPAP